MCACARGVYTWRVCAAAAAMLVCSIVIRARADALDVCGWVCARALRRFCVIAVLEELGVVERDEVRRAGRLGLGAFARDCDLDNLFAAQRVV